MNPMFFLVFERFCLFIVLTTHFTHSAVLKETYEIQNPRLCNIDHRKLDPRGFQCITHSQENTTCDLRPSVPSSKCLGMSITLDKFHSETYWGILTTLIREESTRINLRQIIIQTSNVKTEDLVRIGALIDGFLTPLLWWQVEYETHDWQPETIADIKRGSLKHEVVLERYNELLEPHLRHISSVQYPDSGTCAKAPMGIGWQACTHPGWSSVLNTYFDLHRAFPYAVYATHASSSNSVNDSTAFIVGSDCPNTINKWDCAFLTMTNCTVPHEMFVCRGVDCVHQTRSTWFTNATTHGVAISPDRSSDEYIALKEHSQYPMNTAQNELSIHRRAPQMIYQLSYDHSAETGLKFVAQFYAVESEFAMYYHRFMIRQNYFYRRLVAQSLHQFYVKNNVTPKTRCVAAQVRRGDRVIYGVNMTDFCRNWSQPITPQNPINYCQNSKGKLEPCNGLFQDKGCEGGIPLGAVTLTDIIGKAERLAAPEVRTLVVITDDDVWFNQERQRLKTSHPKWKIIALDAPKVPPKDTEYKPLYDHDTYSGYHYMRSKGGTASGVYFHASLDVAQQCEGFIAHFASGIPMVFRSRMCYQHGGGRSRSLAEAREKDSRVVQGVCPPAYDMRLGLYRK